MLMKSLAFLMRLNLPSAYASNLLLGIDIYRHGDREIEGCVHAEPPPCMVNVSVCNNPTLETARVLQGLQGIVTS